MLTALFLLSPRSDQTISIFFHLKPPVFLDIHGSKAILIVVLKNLFAVLTFIAIILLDHFSVTYRTSLQVHGCPPFYTYICLVPSSSRSMSVTPVRSARASAAGVK